MLKKEHIIKIGCIFVLGLLIQVLTSSLFEGFQQIVKPYMTLRDMICMLGQDSGELCYAIGFFILFKNGEVVIFRPFVDFFIALIIIDILHIIFFNPYEMPLSKFIAFGGSFLTVLFRIKTYLKNAIN